jgi:hypothetical protein
VVLIKNQNNSPIAYPVLKKKLFLRHNFEYDKKNGKKENAARR